MEVKDQPKLRFKGVDITNVNFVSFSLKKEAKIDIQVNPQVFLPSDKLNTFKIIMQVKLSAEDNFQLELIAVGNFEISGVEEITDSIRKDLINANSTAIMFPYIRAFISTFTANLGNTTGAITIPTKFFKGEMKEFLPNESDLMLSGNLRSLSE